MKKFARIASVLYATSALLCVHSALLTSSVSAQKKPNAATRQKYIDEVLATEKAMAAVSKDTSAQLAFDRYLSLDATLYRPRAVRAAEFRQTRPLPRDLILTWKPEYVDVSSAGDMAWTSGPWISASRSSTASDPRFGRYLTIWRKQKDGRWLASVNASPPGPADMKTPPLSTAPGSLFSLSRKPIDEKAGLLAADNAFGVAVRTLDYAAAVKGIAAADLRLIRPGYPPSVGVDSVVAETTGARVTMWFPVDAVVAASGDIGYTRGSYVVSLPRGTREQGDYVRTWRRDRNGTWRVALDMLTGSR